MKKFKLFVLILLIVLSFVSCKKHNTKSLLEGARKIEKDGISIVYLSGDPYQMGFQHGSLLKEELMLMEKLIDDEAKEAMNYVGIKLPQFMVPIFELVIELLIRRTMLKEVPKEYVEELKGISDGSGIPLRKFYILNMGYDFEEYLVNLLCSSFAILPPISDGILHGRNLDWETPEIVSKTNTIFYYSPKKGNKFVSIAPAGFIGILTGMNNKKISITINASLTKDTTLKGIPTFFLLRKIIQYSESLESAIETIKNSKRTVGNNFLISDGNNNLSVLIETTANKLSIRFPQNSTLWATNHFVARGTNVLQKDISVEWDNNTKGRFKRLEEIFLLMRGKKISEYDGVNILRDKINWETGKKDAFCPQSLCSEKTSQSVLFLPTTLEFWLAGLKSPGACNGKYLKFNIKSGKVEMKNILHEDKYIKTDNFNAVKKYIKGKKHLKKKEFSLAKMEFAKVLELENNSPTALRTIGIIYCNAFKDYKNGVKLLLKAIKIANIKRSEFYPYSLNNYFLGKSLIGINDYKSAIEVLNKVFNHRADDCRLAWTELRLGQAYDALNLREKAIIHYRKALLYKEKSSKKSVNKYLKKPFNPEKNNLENRLSSGFFCMY